MRLLRITCYVGRRQRRQPRSLHSSSVTITVTSSGRLRRSLPYFSILSGTRFPPRYKNRNTHGRLSARKKPPNTDRQGNRADEHRACHGANPRFHCRLALSVNFSPSQEIRVWHPQFQQAASSVAFVSPSRVSVVCLILASWTGGEVPGEAERQGRSPRRPGSNRSARCSVPATL
jgi:hypothetical protein